MVFKKLFKKRSGAGDRPPLSAPVAGEEARLSGYGASGKEPVLGINEMIASCVDSEFLDIVSAVSPQLYWDAAYARSGVDFFFRFYITEEQRVVKVAAGSAGQFLSEFSTVAIALPSDRCGTTVFSWVNDDADAESETLRSVIPYNVDTCEFATLRVRSRGNYVTSIVSSFPDGTRASFEDVLGLFFAGGGAVVSVCDRIFPLTRFVADLAPAGEGKSVMGIERRGDSYFIWNMTNIEGKLIPVNSSSFRVSDIRPQSDIFSACAFLTSETIKIHKFPPAERLVFIDSSAGEDDFPRPMAIQSARDAVSSLRETSILETPDAVLSGMTGVI